LSTSLLIGASVVLALSSGFKSEAQSSGGTPAVARDLHLRGDSWSIPKFELGNSKPKAGVFQQNLDHFGAHVGSDRGPTFSQRYWVNSDFVTNPATAPILFHICGESDAEQGYYLNDNTLEWAKALGAHVVYLEHRFYGQSLPFPDTSTTHLTSLTLPNVIEDLATFQIWLTQNKGWNGKWIAIGGSYSGTLSAIYRLRHPELVVGALAASAPLFSGLGLAEGTQSDVDDMSSIDPANSDRQWVWQACTSLGIWEADGPSIQSNTLYPSPWLCGQLFPQAPTYNSSAFDQSFAVPFLAKATAPASNVLFTYGTDDVWTKLGLVGHGKLAARINLLVIQGAGHHFDLNSPDSTDSAAVKAARQEFLTLARSWLNMTTTKSWNSPLY